ncbi:hypothetical protein C9374_013693 [Naegleria lovaniensis]|uniref:Uncharacterized protein n=1 Tax=Naegleria lovaniensis TaxID=51637 RepID=A0AA88GDK5_NAELO|nr:uncharacterized protein C9374_013693 [Naegleria lovaniensis]KAG2372629.1 hypothetical protein C9374_013693 [Naegleria lovaniensis]
MPLFPPTTNQHVGPSLCNTNVDNDDHEEEDDDEHDEDDHEEYHEDEHDEDDHEDDEDEDTTEQPQPELSKKRKQESSVHTSRGSKKIKKEATSSDDGDINRVDKRNTNLEWVLPSKEIPEGDIGVEIRVYISRKTQHQANATDGSKATPLCKYRFTVTEITQTEDHKIYVSQIFQKMENRMKFPANKYIWIEIGKSTERIFVYCQGRGSGSKKAVSKPRTEQDTEKQENKITNQKKKTKNVVSIAVDGTVSLRKEILSAYSKHTSNAILTLDNELSTTSASSTSSSNEYLRQIN